MHDHILIAYNSKRSAGMNFILHNEVDSYFIWKL